MTSNLWARACQLVFGTVVLQIVKSGRFRFLPTLRPDNIRSIPGCIARVIWSGSLQMTRTEHLGLMLVCL